MFNWKRSSKCVGEFNCVEVKYGKYNLVEVRHSQFKNLDIPVFTREEWTAFIEGVKLGEFDLDGSIE